MAGTTGLEPAASAVTVRFQVLSQCVFNGLDDVQTTKKRPFGACCPRVAPQVLASAILGICSPYIRHLHTLFKTPPGTYLPPRLPPS